MTDNNTPNDDDDNNDDDAAVETNVETESCGTSASTIAKGAYVVPGRLDDETESTTSWVDVVRNRSKPVNGKQSGSRLTLFTNRK